MKQPNRLEHGGRIDRDRAIEMQFDGQTLSAFEGDTLASAMLANGLKIVARGFKYHRPRGVFSAGVEEPNALVHLRSGARHEPNARATVVEAYDGLQSTGQNAWPGVRFDISAVNQLLAPFIGAGFYYKTFMGPVKGTAFWMFCEKFIRRAAGMGRAQTVADPDEYEKVNAFCDVLVIGGGPAGLAAAIAAGQCGARVILLEQDACLGGSMLSLPVGGESDACLKAMEATLKGMDNVRILKRTTVFGAYDQDVYGAVERVWDHVEVPPAHQPRQRYWQIRTKQAVMATGAIERPLVFANNDRPGVMLANAVRSYVNRYAVLPGKKIVLATNNDSAYAVAADLVRAGAEVSLLDARVSVPAELFKPLEALGVQLYPGYGILAAKGSRGVSGAKIVLLDENGCARGPSKTIRCDLIAVSGGWTPVVHLWSQRGQKLQFDEQSASFLPLKSASSTLKTAGSANACGDLNQALLQGEVAGQEAAKAVTGVVGVQVNVPRLKEAIYADDWARDLLMIWSVTREDGSTDGKAFVDVQHDVALSDIDLAHREGFVSVEHLKRYTTTGMATDQGKLSNINALARMAQLQALSIPKVGTTTFRPPYTPIAIGAIAGREQGIHFRPTRLTPVHDWHVDNAAVMIEAGAWKRPWYYPEGGETINQAYVREAAHVRKHVGVVDASTLGKIAVQGPDAAEFLNRVYVNAWKKLKIGRLRYGVMLRDDGIVLDDGATARLGENDYFMTTTTANAAKILGYLEHLLQTAWTDLKVHVTSVSDQYAAFAVAGPSARDLLDAVCSGADLSNEALPNNQFVKATIAGVPVRINRMSYSGELAYEVYVASGYAHAVWKNLFKAGASFDIKPYGTESMGALRIEKGHVAGPEIDGRTTLGDLGLAGFASRVKPFSGSVLRHREKLDMASRPTLVGLEIDGDTGGMAGSLIYDQRAQQMGEEQGFLTSTTYSPALKKYISLALLRDGHERFGESVDIVNHVGDTVQTAKVVSPHFFDPEGARQNA